MREKQTGRGTAGRYAKATARLIGVGLDRALADIQNPRDFLRLMVLGDKAQNLFLTRRQCFEKRSLILHL